MAKNEITVDKHALKRAKKRVGLNKTAIRGMVNVAFRKGIRSSEATGHLKDYLELGQIIHCKGNMNVVYGEHIFIIHDFQLVTILHLPNNLKHLVASIIRGKKNLVS